MEEMKLKSNGKKTDLDKIYCGDCLDILPKFIINPKNWTTC